jgi:hypothetical protein
VGGASFDITHVSRLANEAAHSTAHKAISEGVGVCESILLHLS